MAMRQCLMKGTYSQWSSKHWRQGTKSNKEGPQNSNLWFWNRTHIIMKKLKHKKQTAVYGKIWCHNSWQLQQKGRIRKPAKIYRNRCPKCWPEHNKIPMIFCINPFVILKILLLCSIQITKKIAHSRQLLLHSQSLELNAQQLKTSLWNHPACIDFLK